MTQRNVEVFVAESGNGFMADIASWLVEAAAIAGHPSRLVRDGSLPSDSGAINLVVAPHEFYVLTAADDRCIDEAIRNSIPVCTEQPGTRWFDMTVLLTHRSPMVLDINPHGVRALHAAGIDAHHLRLGGVPSMDRRTDATRSTDVLFLGGLTDHRARLLATLAPRLWEHRCDLRLFDFSRPVDGDVESLVFGSDKYDLLADSRLLVNVHRDSGRNDGSGVSNEYFEWARMVEAMANGCVVATEPSTGFAPLIAGVHFVETVDLAATVADLLNDPDRCATIGAAAANAVLVEHRLVDALAPILMRAASTPTTTFQRKRRPPSYRSKLRRAQQIPLLPAFQPVTDLRRQVYAALHAEMAHQRELDAVRCKYRHGSPDHMQIFKSACHDGADPEVSVVVTLFDYASVVTETLDSIAASRDVVVEIIVVDDHSADESRDVVLAFMDSHPDLAVLLLGVDANRGLPASRNLAIEHARGGKIMVMDADNHVYPTCLRRLADALDQQPDAAFAWSMLEEFGTTTGLRSATGWHVPWLCAANHIDAQAMFRSETFERHGRYRTNDPLVFGWEDWEMWLRLAAAGERGAHVAEMLGRYRTQKTSMLSTSNLFGDLMIEHLRELHPTLPWPEAVGA